MVSSSGGKKRKSKKPPAPRQKPNLRFLLWGAAAGFTFLALLGILLLPPKENTAVTPTQVAIQPPVKDDEVYSRPAEHDPSQEKRFKYADKVGTGFEHRVWKADMAILNALNRIDQDESYILRNRMESRFFFGTPYSFQEMHIYTGNRQEQFIQNLEEALNHFMDNTTVKQLDQHGQKWAISIAGQTTHLLHLGLDKPDIQAGRGNLVIVIDDLGECMVFPRKLAELDFPVTFSILPYLPRTSEVAEFASVNGFEVMLHMPMEPDAYIRGVEPGPGALFVDMKPEQIRQQMIHALQQIPQAQGVNNHMGSAFTRNHQGMRIVFEELMKRDLFFLDSVTTPDSVAPYLAREMGLDFMQRHVFLDNIRSREAIMHQLQKAEQMASRHGMAVAIGHPHPETLQTLRHWNRERDHRVNIASVDELILQQKIMAVSAR